MWEPPEYPGPCFDLYFDGFDGFIFEAEKPFENVCATGASPEGCSGIYSALGTKLHATQPLACDVSTLLKGEAGRMMIALACFSI